MGINSLIYFRNQKLADSKQTNNDKIHFRFPL